MVEQDSAQRIHDAGMVTGMFEFVLAWSTLHGPVRSRRIGRPALPACAPQAGDIRLCVTVVCGTSVSVWCAGKQAQHVGWQADQLTFAGEADIHLLGPRPRTSPQRCSRENSAPDSGCSATCSTQQNSAMWAPSTSHHRCSDGCGASMGIVHLRFWEPEAAGSRASGVAGSTGGQPGPVSRQFAATISTVGLSSRR